MVTTTSHVKLDADDQAILLDLVRRSVTLGLLAEPPLEPMVEYHSPALRRWRSSFVTLRQDGKIVGRAGTVQPTAALVSDVCKNAHAVAYHCNLPLSPSPLMAQVCLVSELKHLKAKSFEDVCERIAIGEHGALLQHTNGAGTLTPDHWHQCNDTAEFTRQLCARAGVCPVAWQSDAQLLVYRVESLPEMQITPYQTRRPDKPR